MTHTGQAISACKGLLLCPFTRNMADLKKQPENLKSEALLTGMRVTSPSAAVLTGFAPHFLRQRFDV